LVESLLEMGDRWLVFEDDMFKGTSAIYYLYLLKREKQKD